MEVTVELSGGAELLFGNKRKHEVQLPASTETWTMGNLLPWLRDNLLQVWEQLSLTYYFSREGESVSNCFASVILLYPMPKMAHGGEGGSITALGYL